MSQFRINPAVVRVELCKLFDSVEFWLDEGKDAEKEHGKRHYQEI